MSYESRRLKTLSLLRTLGRVLLSDYAISFGVFLGAFIPFLSSVNYMMEHGAGFFYALGDAMRGFGLALLVTALLLLFVVIFRVVFGATPTQLIVSSLRRVMGVTVKSPHGAPPSPEFATLPQEPDVVGPPFRTAESSEELLGLYAAASHRLANRIFSRGGLYLFVGTFLAISGMGFFYVESAATKSPARGAEISTILSSLLPRFGILFFIELVAFFFLRQYRATMDEFRYFESIARSREDNLMILLLSKRDWAALEFYKVIPLFSYNQTPGKLSKGETTEMLETRKLTRDELLVFETVADLAGKLVEPKKAPRRRKPPGAPAT